MYLKSVNGKILYEGKFATLKTGVEMAVQDNVVLNGVDLRKANLAAISLDEASLPNACFWGANLRDANMTGCNLAGSDFRTANLLDTCLAEANCNSVDFSGAYFSRTILTGTDLSNARFSCPSIFSINLVEAKTLQGAIYSHRGEIDCIMSQAPLIINGLKKPLIFMDESVLVGNSIKKSSLRAVIFKRLYDDIAAHNLMTG